MRARHILVLGSGYHVIVRFQFRKHRYAFRKYGSDILDRDVDRMQWVVAVLNERFYITHVFRDGDVFQLLPELATPF